MKLSAPVLALGVMAGLLPGRRVQTLWRADLQIRSLVVSEANPGSREFYVMTTIPALGVARGFGVTGLSDTPDPRPANNIAEKTIP